MNQVASEDMRRVKSALESVRDPCHALSGHDLSIVDLGLVNQVRRIGDVIEVSVTFTEPTCVFADRIVCALEDLAATLPGVSKVDVLIEPLPIWDPSRMSARAHKLFEARRTQFKSAADIIPISVATSTGARDERSS